MEEERGSDYVLISHLIGHEGMILHESEKLFFVNLVLLHDLRELYNREIPDAVIIVENIKPLETEILKKTCNDIYNSVFENEKNIINVDILKTSYPVYYNYVTTYTSESTTFEEFKEMYYKIVNELNFNIRTLVSKRERIEYYKARNLSVPKNRKISNELLQTKNNETHVENFVNKFEWNDSFQVLQKLFKNLVENGYMNELSDENLYEHFFIPSQNSTVEFQNPKVDSTKIEKMLWKGEYDELALLIDYLLKKNKISYKAKLGLYKLCSNHFSNKLGQPISNKSLANAAARITFYEADDSFNFIMTIIKDGLNIHS